MSLQLQTVPLGEDFFFPSLFTKIIESSWTIKRTTVLTLNLSTVTYLGRNEGS